MTGSVSGKTDYLIAGADAGAKKMEDAKVSQLHSSLFFSSPLFSFLSCCFFAVQGRQGHFGRRISGPVAHSSRKTTGPSVCAFLTFLLVFRSLMCPQPKEKKPKKPTKKEEEAKKSFTDVGFALSLTCKAFSPSSCSWWPLVARKQTPPSLRLNLLHPPPHPLYPHPHPLYPPPHPPHHLPPPPPLTTSLSLLSVRLLLDSLTLCFCLFPLLSSRSESSLWVDKYKPALSSQIIGNSRLLFCLFVESLDLSLLVSGNPNAIATIKNYLKNWFVLRSASFLIPSLPHSSCIVIS
jgi:hypothetical protein